MWFGFLTKWGKDNSKKENLEEYLLSNPEATDVELWSAVKQLEREKIVGLALKHWSNLNEPAKQAVTTILRQKGIFLDLKKKLSEGRGKDLKNAIELAKILEFAEAVPLLAEKLNHFDIEVSLAAMEGLKSFPPHISLPKLLDCLTEPEKFIPARISDIFLAYGEESIGYLASVTNAHEVQSYAISILGQFGEASYPVLKDFLNHPSGELREKALEALLNGENLTTDILELVCTRLKDPNRRVKVKAIEVWAKFKGKEEPEFLQPLLINEDWLVRNKALASLETHFKVDKSVWEIIKEPSLGRSERDKLTEWFDKKVLGRGKLDGGDPS